MNILITFLTAHKNTFGGVEKSIFSLIDGLRKTNNNVYVYTSINDDHLENFFYSKYLDCNFNCLENEIDNEIRKTYLKYELEINNELEKIILENNIEYVLIIDQLWGIIPNINFKNKYNVKMGILYHMTFQPDLIIKSLNNRYNNYFAVSNEVRNKIIQFTNTQIKIDILPNCYIPEDYNEIGNKDGNYIFCNSRLAEGKGIENLLSVYKDIVIKYPDLKLNLCGGEFHFGKRDKILNIIYSFKMLNPSIADKIKVIDKLNWDEIPNNIKNSKMIVLPTSYETFGIAALESIACCKPLITTNVGNLPNLVENSGILVDYNNKQQLYYAIIKVLDDDVLKNRLKRNCKTVRKKYTSIYIANKLLNYIQGSEL